ncbi:MAG: hypothetical protein ABJ004_02680 [Cyclobacteriaceae bacterium]
MITCAFAKAKAQQRDTSTIHRTKLNVETPIQYGLGYEGRIYKNWNGVFQVGFLTEPNSTLVLNVLESFGVEQSVVLMIEDAFESGLVLEQGINYNLKRSYFGIFAQQYFLRGSDTPTELVEDAMGEDLSQYPRLQNRINSNDEAIELKSNLYQLGVLYGYRLPLKNQLELNFELAISVNLGSQSSVSSDERNYNDLSKRMDVYLGDIYRRYGYVPSITVAFVRKFR